MSQALRIAVADDEQDMRYYLQKIIPLAGHQVVATAENGKQLIEQCRATHPDVVITDIKMPDMDGIEAARNIYQDRPTPIILVSAYHDADLVERANADFVQAYLVKPIKQADLAPAIAVAVRRFQQLMAAHKEAQDLRQALEDRKVIERAKGIMMRRLGLEEQDSFHRLQRLASNRNRKLADIAHQVLGAEEIFQALERT
jgi:response regulator NasT